MVNISPANIDELNRLIQDVAKERSKYNEYKILVEVIFQCTKPSSKLNSDLRLKIYNIVMATDVQHCLDLNLKETNLLGLNVLKQPPELTYEEKEALKISVENAIIVKSRKLAKDLQEIGVPVTSVAKQIETRSPLDLTTEEKTLIELTQTLNDKQMLYRSKLHELLEIYENIKKIRTDVLPELTIKVVADCDIQMRRHSLKSEILEQKTRLDVFTEEKESMDYYKLVVDTIIKQQDECKADIERLKVLKEKYKQVSCKQYDEILHSYLKYKCAVDARRDFVNPSTMKQ